MIAALLAMLLVVGLGPPAWAHTQLASSAPTDGATLGTPSSNVVLTFSRPVELLPNAVRVVADPGRVNSVQISGDGTVVTASFDPPLADGAFDIAWRILASDGHPRDGTVSFTVTAAATRPAGAAAPAIGDDNQPAGSASTGEAEAATSGDATPAAGQRGIQEDSEAPDQIGLSSTFETLATLARIVFYIALMISVGLALFKSWPHRGERDGAPMLAGWFANSAAVAFVASTGEIAMHVATLSGRGIAGVADVATWRAVLATGMGTAVWLRSIGLALLVYGGRRRRRRDLASGPGPFKLSGAVLAVGSFQFLGHTASTTPAVVVRSADAVHAFAAATWVGGIVGLGLLAHHGIHEGRRHAAIRFSTAATFAVVAVAIAGSALTIVNLPSLSGLWTTGWGQVLLGKIAVVALLGAVGGYNHLRVIPALTDGDDDALDTLQRTVSIEAALVLAVLSLTAVLVNLTPL